MMRAILTGIIFFFGATASYGSPNPVTQDSRPAPVELWMGEPIEKIVGATWGKNEYGVIPLAMSLTYSQRLVVHVKEWTFHGEAEQAYLLCSTEHLLESAAFNVFSSPIPFGKAKAETAKWLRNHSITDDKILGVVKNWAPSLVPPDNDKKFLLKVNRRRTDAVTIQLDDTFKLRANLTEIELNNDKWQLEVIVFR